VLEFGHFQHVRHNTPAVERPWVLPMMEGAKCLDTSSNIKNAQGASRPKVKKVNKASDLSTCVVGDRASKDSRFNFCPVVNAAAAAV
jgi:hypothetical protein